MFGKFFNRVPTKPTTPNIETVAETTPREEHEIIDLNLNMMNSDMLDLLFNESIGGNAGNYEIDGKKYFCGGANARFNRITGEIVVFGNIQDSKVQEAIRADVNNELLGMTLRVAIGPGPRKIVDVMIKDFDEITGEDNPSIEAKAKEILDKSVEAFNNSTA